MPSTASHVQMSGLALIRCHLNWRAHNTAGSPGQLLRLSKLLPTVEKYALHSWGSLRETCSQPLAFARASKSPFKGFEPCRAETE
eukprot:5320099-Amphidinium_carterae.1